MNGDRIGPGCGRLGTGARCGCGKAGRNAFALLPCGRAVVYLAGAGGGHGALIDGADLGRVLSFPGRWYAQRRQWTLYAAATANVGGRKVTVRLHRFLLEPPADMEVDHLDHDGLNNTRANLRIVTPEANKRNLREEGRDVGRRWYECGLAPAAPRCSEA